MSLLQAYQSELLADLDEGEDIGPNAVCELRRATDLSLRAMAAPGGHWETFMVNLSNIKRKIKSFLWMLLFSLWLLRDAVKLVVKIFQESAKQEEAAFHKLLPRRTHISGAAEREQPQTSKQSVAFRAPPLR